MIDQLLPSPDLSLRRRRRRIAHDHIREGTRRDRGGRNAGCYTGVAVHTGAIIVARAGGCAAAVAQDLLVAEESLSLVQGHLRHLFGVFFAVADPPFGDEVVLDPDDFADGADQGHLALQLQTRV